MQSDGYMEMVFTTDQLRLLSNNKPEIIIENGLCKDEIYSIINNKWICINQSVFGQLIINPGTMFGLLNVNTNPINDVCTNSGWVIGDGYTNGYWNSGWSAGDYNGTTLDINSGTITINKSGFFQVCCTGNNTSASGDTCVFQLYKNGIAISDQIGDNKFTIVSAIHANVGDVIDIRSKVSDERTPPSTPETSGGVWDDGPITKDDPFECITFQSCILSVIGA